MGLSPETIDWVEKAEGDTAAARLLLGTGDAQLGWVVAFHSQPSAEKYLKAYLISQRVMFKKIHDLEELLNLCNGNGASFDVIRGEAQRLQPYSVDVRYPGRTPSKTAVDLAVADMESVRTVVRRALGMPV